MFRRMERRPQQRRECGELLLTRRSKSWLRLIYEFYDICREADRCLTLAMTYVESQMPDSWSVEHVQ